MRAFLSISARLYYLYEISTFVDTADGDEVHGLYYLYEISTFFRGVEGLHTILRQTRLTCLLFLSKVRRLYEHLVFKCGFRIAK